ncbi:MAG: hypothetical protein CM1200mP2_19310 [Planctomycetaceae bacterium]|nr:MAG: hypothetical protein CM1200mP2_19310 [Planctomycetaceae bacterium]
MKPELDKRQRRWELSLKRKGVGWHDLENPKLTSSSGAVLTVEKDRSVRVVGDPAESERTRSRQDPTEAGPGDSLERVVRQDPAGEGPGRAADGRFLLSSLAVGISDSADGKLKGLPLNNARDVDSPVTRRSADHWWQIWLMDGTSARQVVDGRFEVASAVSKNDWVGNPLPGGIQDGAAQVFTVYAGSPAPSAGTIDRFRYWSKSKKGAACGFYLLRPDAAGGFRVVQNMTCSRASTGSSSNGATPGLGCATGDLLANSSNGGPGIVSGL